MNARNEIRDAVETMGLKLERDIAGERYSARLVNGGEILVSQQSDMEEEFLDLPDRWEGRSIAIGMYDAKGGDVAYIVLPSMRVALAFLSSLSMR